MYIRSRCPLFARMANVRSGAKYGRSLTILGNNERNGCKIMGKIVEIIGKILDNPDSITHPFKPCQLLKNKVLPRFAQI